MGIENPRREDLSSEPIESAELLKAEEQWYSEISRNYLTHAPEGADVAEFLRARWEKHRNLFAGAEERFDTFLQKIGPASGEPEEVIHHAAQELQQARRDSFSLLDFEQRVRNATTEKGKEKGAFSLTADNLLLASKKTDKEIELHLLPARAMPLSQKIGSFTQGLHELAHRIKSQPDLQEISRISADTWIGSKHPKLVERFGFSIDEASQEVYIHKDEFLTRYSQDDSHPQTRTGLR